MLVVRLVAMEMIDAETAIEPGQPPTAPSTCDQRLDVPAKLCEERASMQQHAPVLTCEGVLRPIDLPVAVLPNACGRSMSHAASPASRALRRCRQARFAPSI